ncbi:efflux RND transporter permease subunit, partial [Sinorhizobium meliloti]|uniref:efflux RND transporter permease subunit n=1 Tax=Rhizobium meliloti TaxID=382 RepID=UPI000FE12EBB
LSELCKVIDTYEQPKSFSRFNGQPGVTFAVFRAKGASEVSVAETVGKTLDEIRAKHPDVSIEMVDDSVYFTYGNYEAAIHTLIEGAVLAVIVVMLFLRNWRATLISAVALPLSAIPTFWVMELLGFSLNLVSFLAMTLATGILVDDAIVEIENIERHIRMGKSPYRAAIEAADEIGLAVIATTFTIIAVFVPVSFMPGIPGQYFIQFGLTVAVSVFFSLLVARLITPVMAAYLMKPSDVSGHHDDEGFMMRQYTRLVRFTTKRWYTRYSTLLAAILVSVGSVVALLVFVPGSFLPPEDSSRVSLSIELPPDAMLADTDRTTTEIYNRVKDIDGVENVFVLGGASPKGDLELRRAAVTVLLEKLDHSLINKVVNDVIGRTPLIGQYLPKLPP